MRIGPLRSALMSRSPKHPVLNMSGCATPAARFDLSSVIHRKSLTLCSKAFALLTYYI